ncbi:EFR1 family ferrodoxin [Maridesulfovibrio sp. FT414]|uniref:EFR1 family ferrodoxin n=1 Tax=Maridesulfovibrio sp. FT414 TaxID=2979469 RepID=UPI003D807C22
MNITSAKLVFFSPTGTTEKVLRGIAHGTGLGEVETLDITSPESRQGKLTVAKDELLVIGVPVYMGRVPGLLNRWLNEIKADGTPAVCVVVYGNRVYDDALLELKNMVTERGCVPVAGAAYIGEHSFSTPQIPTAHGRPDSEDLSHAASFGAAIRQKLDAAKDSSDFTELHVPGKFPYRGTTELWNVDFIAVNENCVQCGLCAEACPAGAIDRQDSSLTDQVKCITCCACLKQCPQQARTMKDGPVKDARERLHNLFGTPKKPEYFL